MQIIHKFHAITGKRCVRFNWYLMQCMISERCIYFDEFGSVGTARGYPPRTC